MIWLREIHDMTGLHDFKSLVGLVGLVNVICRSWNISICRSWNISLLDPHSHAGDADIATANSDANAHVLKKGGCRQVTGDIWLWMSVAKPTHMRTGSKPVCLFRFWCWVTRVLYLEPAPSVESRLHHIKSNDGCWLPCWRALSMSHSPPAAGTSSAASSTPMTVPPPLLSPLRMLLMPMAMSCKKCWWQFNSVSVSVTNSVVTVWLWLTVTQCDCQYLPMWLWVLWVWPNSATIACDCNDPQSSAALAMASVGPAAENAQALPSCKQLSQSQSQCQHAAYHMCVLTRCDCDMNIIASQLYSF